MFHCIWTWTWSSLSASPPPLRWSLTENRGPKMPYHTWMTCLQPCCAACFLHSLQLRHSMCVTRPRHLFPNCSGFGNRYGFSRSCLSPCVGLSCLLLWGRSLFLLRPSSSLCLSPWKFAPFVFAWLRFKLPCQILVISSLSLLSKCTDVSIWKYLFA